MCLSILSISMHVHNMVPDAHGDQKMVSEYLKVDL